MKPEPSVEELRTTPELAFPPQVWGVSCPAAGVARLKERLIATRREVDVERARYATEAYQQSEGEPMPIRRAKMLLHLARNTSVAIQPGGLIVGNRTVLPRMGVIAPEGAVAWVDRELEALPVRPQDPFDITAEQIEELRTVVFPYWRGSTLADAVRARLPEPVVQAVAGKVFSLNQTDHAQGHILPDVETWLRLGIGGLRERAQQAHEQGAGPATDRRVFDEAALLALQAAEELIARYATLAQRSGEEAASEEEGRRLKQVAATCSWISRAPPRSFREAVQSVWFLFVLLQMESNASSFSPGRLDQYLWPYLAHDLDQGRLTLAQAQVLLEHLWLQFNSVVMLRSSASARYFAGFPIGFNVVLGGQRPQGGDATNALSYMCLRAQADLGLPQPNLSIRIHRDSPQQFLQAAAAVISTGSGMPQVFNDEVIIPGQMARGIDAQDALNYAVVGCVELSTPGRALGWSDAALFNMTRVLEITLFGGRDPLTGMRIGLATPALDELADFGALEQAYDSQLAHFVALMVQGCNVVDQVHAELLPSPFLSLVIDDSIERGLDVTAGGARYNFSGVQGVQIANVADSLAAVREAVFTKQWLRAGELLEALRHDFDGHGPLRQRLLNRVPKYGNDDDRVDCLASRWADRYSELVSQYANVRGGTYQPGFYTVSAHLPMGADVGATPDGRRAGEPLADGGLSPSAGRDRRGPTAVLRSVGKIDLAQASNGTLLNMKFLPSFFDAQNALVRFVTLLRAFCALRVPHVQFNVVSAATLRLAQAQPDEYRHLVVRVAGYSAYFTDLEQSLQDEIISRTEFADI